MYYSGCNCYINQGKCPEEPIGTAQAMHECGECEDLSFCLLKQQTETFPYDVTEFKTKWDETQRIKLTNTPL